MPALLHWLLQPFFIHFQEESDAVSRALSEAFDTYLVTAALVPLSRLKALNLSDGLRAVRQSSLNCEHCAQAVLANLQNAGISHFVIVSLDGHHALRSNQTRHYFDLECYAGCARQSKLPFNVRAHALERHAMVSAQRIFTDFAELWLAQREAALNRAYQS